MKRRTIRTLLLLAATSAALLAVAATGFAHGSRDDEEGPGTVTSFTDGVLTLHLLSGEDVKGKVDGRTEIECSSRTPAARAASDGDDDDHGDDDDDQGEDRHGDDDRGRADGERRHHGQHKRHRHRHRHHHARDCDTSALTPGAAVREAELRTTSAGLVFREIELTVR